MLFGVALRILLIAGHVLFFSLWLHAQPRMYMTKAILEPNVIREIDRMGFGTSKIFYTHDFDVKDNGEIDSAYFRKRIKDLVPERNFSGPAVLDWEGKAYEVFRTEQPGSPKFQEYLQKYIGLLAYAKKLLPNAKWGYYGFPLTTYWWKTDSLWQPRNQALVPLLQASDMLFPYLYDFFQDGSMGWLDEEGYVKTNTEQCLALGASVKKPVVPFIWHRYHDATEKIGLLQIPEEEFRNHLKVMMETTYQGNKIYGLVWWQEEMYFTSDTRLRGEKGNRSDTQFISEVILKYGNIIRSEVKAFR
jgi:hypothetical protein